MPAGTLTGSISVGLTLTTSSYLITSTGTITYGLGDGRYGVFDAAAGPALRNAGQITGFFGGVFLADGGTVTNTGYVAGHYGVEINNDTALMLNGGTIIATADAVALTNGYLANTAANALIQGANIGVFLGSGTVFNAGTIAGGAGVELYYGGSVLNQGIIAAGQFEGIFVNRDAATIDNTKTGFIGGAFGIYARYNAAAISNAGTIIGHSGEGIDLKAGGTVINAGLIQGGNGEAVYFGGAGGDLLVAGPGAAFSGSVLAFGSANTLELGAGTGSLAGIGGEIFGFDTLNFDSAAAWTLSGATYGFSGGVVINGFAAGDAIVLDSFTATSDNFAYGSLVLAGGGGSVGLDLTGFSVAAGFSFSGVDGNTTLTYSAALMNSYTVLSGGALTLSAPLTGGESVLFANNAGDSGALILTPGAFEITSLVSNGTASGISAAIGGNIEGFVTGDAIVLQSLDALYATLDDAPSAAANNASFDSAIALLASASGKIYINPDGSAYATANEFGETITEARAGSIQSFADEIRSALFEGYADSVALTISITAGTGGDDNAILTTDGDIIEVTCFTAGTRIATAGGPRAIEDLRIGDAVQTMHAGAQYIKFIGRRAYAAPFCNRPHVLPIRIRADALSMGVPSRDLLVSPGHAIAVGGALVHAGLLVNGVSITQERHIKHVEYYHIELATHEVIFAENCPAESFRGEVFRGRFQNAAEFYARYPGGRAPEAPCLRQLENGAILHAIKRRITARARAHSRTESCAAPWRRPGTLPVSPACSK